MTMFRTEDGPASFEHFGVGSIVKSIKNERYVVITNSDTTSVMLCNLKTFRTIPPLIEVQNVYHLSEKEVRELVKYIPNGEFTTLEFDPKGLKQGFMQAYTSKEECEEATIEEDSNDGG